MKRLFIYLSCFLLVGGSGTALQSCKTWEVPAENTLSINKGLVAYLPFTKGSLKDSLIATDQRRINNATWGDITTKPTFVKGFLDAQDNADLAISFNGTSDFIALQDNPTLQFKTQFSISLWIKPDINQLKNSADAMQIFHKSNYNGTDNESFGSIIRPLDASIPNSPFFSLNTKALMVTTYIKMENTNSRCAVAGPGWQGMKSLFNLPNINSS